jgi:hypothetical protein
VGTTVCGHSRYRQHTLALALPRSGEVFTVDYQDKGSASDDITEAHLIEGGWAWSAGTIIWNKRNKWGIRVTCAHSSLRSGRVRIYITYGSKLVDLPVPMQVEYYTTDGWIANSADSCLSTALKALMNFQVNLNSGETCVQDTGTPGVSGQRCAVTELLAPVNERFLALPSAMALPPIDIYNRHLQPQSQGSGRRKRQKHRWKYGFEHQNLAAL